LEPHDWHNHRRLRGDSPRLPFGSVGVERDPDDKGEGLIWLAPNVVDRLRAQRRPGEGYSDVILRIAVQK